MENEGKYLYRTLRHKGLCNSIEDIVILIADVRLMVK